MSHISPPKKQPEGGGKVQNTTLWWQFLFLMVLILNIFPYFVLVGFILFQEQPLKRRGEGLHGKPTRLSTRWRQGQLGCIAFSTKSVSAASTEGNWARGFQYKSPSRDNDYKPPVFTVVGVGSQGRQTGTSLQLSTRGSALRGCVT